MKDPAVFDQLGKNLDNPKHPDLVISIEALGMTGNKMILEKLTPLLDHKNRAVKKAAKKAIAHLEKPE